MAVLQAEGAVNAVEENLRRIDGYAGRAAEQGVELLVTPELFATGYAPALVVGSDGEGIRAELAGIARRHGIALVGSTVEAAGERHHISASLFDRQGMELTRYRKSHLFGPEEKSVFTPGNDLPDLVPLMGLSVALGICYDIEFPEFVRSAALRGADLLCIPTAVPTTGDVGGRPPELTYNAERISTLLVPARALENGVYIAYANHTGPDFTGLSSIASPYGTFLGLAGGGEELLVAHVDRSEVGRARGLNTYLTCMRPALYG
ncbi:carbon-nitrogen hydrolase [Arthrobacter sp. MSA 4-2]|uniref:nitrilase-related carbon-nitrogen hydrolase n=1 Tax=Arthrobacter sp. MSA 4-2 TaxID=2794349 RepID=UPI0018E73C4D|nr:nitrilase-related carbon-nitrogen hydrolase [Arthrobacter sp. MSA 4-2]MBJ2119513.1 carbon-nitrogen hydrolase [Arthrobacter sp. MSA 4-2]